MFKNNKESFFYKYKWNIIRLISFFIFTITFFYISTYATPKVYISYKIDDVSEKNFNIFLNNNDNIPVSKKIRTNCRSFFVNIRVTYPYFVVRDVKIDNEFLYDYILNNTNKNENNFISLGSYNGRGKNEYSEKIDLYMEGITDRIVKDFFSNYKIKLEWRSIFNTKRSSTYVIETDD